MELTQTDNQMDSLTRDDLLGLKHLVSSVNLSGTRSQCRQAEQFWAEVEKKLSWQILKITDLEKSKEMVDTEKPKD